MQNYTLIPSLSKVVLEESWVLGIEARPGILTFTLDMVLTDKHPRYHPPRPGNQFCYLTGTVKFVGATALTWLNQGARPSRDANSELDYGNIDALVFEGDHYQLEGSWGEIVVVATELEVTYDDEGVISVSVAGKRIDPRGNGVSIDSAENHTPIDWDLPG